MKDKRPYIVYGMKREVNPKGEVEAVTVTVTTQSTGTRKITLRSDGHGTF